MKKLMMLLVVFAAFTVAGCGGDDKEAAPAPVPHANTAVQKDSNTQEDKQTAAKSKPKKKDYFANCTGEPLTHFKY